uniref:RecF/RecN/SMC N-terminal domain-containing protein n=1 Tax=Octactis speculum TaxID=3111310 RepID=A0A7S2ANS6_9STRA
MDSITFDGDQVNRKGALEGGYHDDRKSKLLAFYGIRKAKEELIKHEAEHETCEAEATAVDQQIAHLMGTIQKSEAKRNNLHEVAKQVIEEVTLRKKELSKLEDQINSVIEKQPSMLRELTQLQAQAQSFRTEIGTPLKTTLTKEEHSTLKRLTALSQRYSEELAARDAALEDVAVERKRLQSLLKDNLSKRANEARERLSSALGDIGADAAQRQEILANRRLELDRQDRGTKSVAASLKEIRKAYQERRSIVNDCQSDIEVLRANEAEIQERLEHVEKTSEKQLNKRSMLVQKREENLRKIQELGSLPTAELDTHSHLNIKDLMKKLHSTNQKLTKYSHVNKKALDQYVNFSEQREQLLERKKELDDGSAAIRDLISSLDQQKDEAILRTFKGVSKHFSEVFSELVPSGSGHLIMRTSTDLEEDDEEEGDGSGGTPRMTVSDFEGVQVKVSFTPGGEVFLMSQLSGGQKAIVALSIVFAIQRCDPAPFYLFDELDQALDSTYRAAVAAMIQRQASHPTNPTQFITTTFRPELVNVAAKCYGISLQNKNSNIHPLSKGEALSFVADLMNEEEGVGTVSATPKTRGVAEEDSDSDDDDEAENSASRNQTAAHRKRKR